MTARVQLPPLALLAREHFFVLLDKEALLSTEKPTFKKLVIEPLLCVKKNPKKQIRNAMRNQNMCFT